MWPIFGCCEQSHTNSSRKLKPFCFKFVSLSLHLPLYFFSRTRVYSEAVFHSFVQVDCRKDSWVEFCWELWWNRLRMGYLLHHSCWSVMKWWRMSQLTAWFLGINLRKVSSYGMFLNFHLNCFLSTSSIATSPASFVNSTSM